MTQFYMGVKPGVGPVLKILKYDNDDPLTLANTAYDRYYFNSENQELGYLYKTLEYAWSKSVFDNLPESFHIDGDANTAYINGTTRYLYTDARIIYRFSNILPDIPYPMMLEFRTKGANGRYYAGHTTGTRSSIVGTTSIIYNQFDYLASHVKGFSGGGVVGAPYKGILVGSSPAFNGIRIGELIYDASLNVSGSETVTHLMNLWSLPGDSSSMPTYTPAPNKEALRLSSSGFTLARPGYDINSTGFGVHIINSERSPALCVMSGEIDRLGGGQQITIPAPDGLTLAPTAVVDFMYNLAADPEWTVPARRNPDTGTGSFNVSYSVQPNSITIYNEASSSIKMRYVVFNADTRPQTTGGNEIFRKGNGFIQIKKPGSSDTNPIPSDILVDTRYPSMQIVKEGYLPRSAFVDVGRDTTEHRRFGRYKAIVDFTNSGFMPYVKYTRVFESAFGPPYWELGIYNVGVYFSTRCPNSTSSMCILENNRAIFYINHGEWTFMDDDTDNEGRPVVKYRRVPEYDPQGIRYYIFGITK